MASGDGDGTRCPPLPSRPLQLATPEAANEAGHLATTRAPMVSEERERRIEGETRREGLVEKKGRGTTRQQREFFV